MKLKSIVLLSVPAFMAISCGTDNSNSLSSSRIATENPTIVENDIRKSVNAPTENIGAISTMEFEEVNHDFGNVIYPSENMYTFKFKNTGNEPITIVSAKASCGCTIPNKPEEPVLPGEIGEIDVIFRPKQGQAGTPVTKRITVIANTDPKETYINVKANVLKAM